MPLTPEQQQRIVEEERQRIEEEIFRQKIRRQYLEQLSRESPPPNQPEPSRIGSWFTNLTTRSNPLLWVYILCLLLLVFVVGRQFGWFRSRHAVSQQSPSERAVFGTPAGATAQPPAPVISLPPSAPSESTRTTTASTDLPRESTRNREVRPGVVPPGISGLLDRWASSVLSGDLQEQVRCYAPVADVYFNKRNVTNREIEADKRRMFSLYPQISKYQISNVRLEEYTGERATLTIVKDWNASGSRGRFAGSEQEELTMVKVGGEWKISGERENRVFWRLRQ